MSQFTAYYGIFIQSKEPTDEFISDCIRELKPVCNSSIKRAFDDNGNGIRMYFEDTKTVATVLKRKKLLISGKRYDICPLVTYLTLHKVVAVIEHDIKRSLSDKLQRYLGPVLKINELPRPTDPSVLSANWRVIIEIPELEALKVSQNFKKKNKNVSNDTNIEFFYIEDRLKVSFFCHKCQKDGHISHHCNMLFKRRIKQTINKPSDENTLNNICFQKDIIASTSAAASDYLVSISPAASNNNIQEQTSRETIGQQKRQAYGTSINRPSKRRLEDVQNILRASSFRKSVATPPTKNIHSSLAVKSESCILYRRTSAPGVIRILPNSQTEECVQKASGTTPPTKNIHSSVTLKSESFTHRRNSATGEIKILPNSRTEECVQKASGTTLPTKSIHSFVTLKSESFTHRTNSATREIKILPNSRTEECVQKAGGTAAPTKNIHSFVTFKSESCSPHRTNSATTEIKILPNSRTEECFQKAGGTTLPTKNIHSSVTVKSESFTHRTNSATREIKILPNSRTEECVQKAGGTTLPTKCIHSSVTVKRESFTHRTNSATREIKIVPNSRTEECVQKAGGTTLPTKSIHSSVTAKSESYTPHRRNCAPGMIKILPNSRTEDCVHKASGAHRLSQSQLEIFLNHIKGKKNVPRILKMYKNIHKISAKALKEQLNEIVRLYHASKLPETKEDKSLIRWLECLVERLHKTHRYSRKDGRQNLPPKKRGSRTFTNTHLYISGCMEGSSRRSVNE